MAFISQEKIFSKRWFISWSIIILGAFITASGFVLFINPYNFIPGGVYGISIVVHFLTQNIFDFWDTGIPIGLFGLILFLPLTIIAIIILGPRFGIKTIVGFIFTSIFMDFLTSIIGNADPLNLKNDLLLASIFGGVFIGSGIGLILKSKATSGGSDVIAMIISKITKWQLSHLIIYVDTTIILFGLIVFKDWKIPMYSWLIIFISGKAMDLVIAGISYDKALIIISDKHNEIRDKIVNDLNRGGTFLSGEGMYDNKPKKIIYTVVNRREISILEDFINKIDPNAFITVIDAKEIMGEGIKSITG
jgi:uncharacterized membrane-anchored protein YitT (DUF2179 family)